VCDASACACADVCSNATSQAPVGYDAFGYGVRDTDGATVHDARRKLVCVCNALWFVTLCSCVQLPGTLGGIRVGDVVGSCVLCALTRPPRVSFTCMHAGMLIDLPGAALATSLKDLYDDESDSDGGEGEAKHVDAIGVTAATTGGGVSASTTAGVTAPTIDTPGDSSTKKKSSDGTKAKNDDENNDDDGDDPSDADSDNNDDNDNDDMRVDGAHTTATATTASTHAADDHAHKPQLTYFEITRPKSTVVLNAPPPKAVPGPAYVVCLCVWCMSACAHTHCCANPPPPAPAVCPAARSGSSSMVCRSRSCLCEIW
jgi:hypothetical protein